MSVALWLSFRVALVATALSVLLGLPLAWLLARRRVPLAAMWEGLLTLPLVMPPTVLGYYLLVLVGRRTPFGRLFETLFDAPLTFSVHGAVLAATVSALPLLVRFARASLASVDPMLERAARSLGANEFRVALTVTLPLARRGVAAAITLAFARALGEFGITLMVAGDIPGETRTAALAVYDAVQSGRDAEAAGLVAALSAIALASVMLASWWEGQRDGR